MRVLPRWPGIVVRLAAAAATTAAATVALAGPTCTADPKDKWMSEAAFRAKIAEMGHTISVFKVTAGNCYEIYGRDAKGKRVEIYFNPVTAAAVKSSAN